MESQVAADDGANRKTKKERRKVKGERRKVKDRER